MSFRKYGGINYSSKNNIVHSNYSNNSNLNIQNRSGMPNSREVFESNIDMNGNSILNVGCIYFADGSVQCTANTSGGVAATGATGAAGTTGATGPNGSIGATGADCVTIGNTGATGNVGSIGVQGYTGLTVGLDGAMGTTGLGQPGPIGATGLTMGTKGATGYDGLGAPGSAGDTGLTAGPKGATGFTGAAGVGNTGNTGSTGYTGSPGSTGAKGEKGSIGPTGVTGGIITITSRWTYTGSELINNVPAQNITIATGQPTETGYTGTGTIELNPYGGEVTVGTNTSGVTGTSLNVYGPINAIYNNPLQANPGPTLCQITSPNFNATSDYRIKECVQSIHLQYYNMDDLNPVFYYNRILRKGDFGFLAHEVQEIFPFLVNGVKDDQNTFQSLNYMGFIALLITEIKDLKGRVKQLETKLLKNK